MRPRHLKRRILAVSLPVALAGLSIVMLGGFADSLILYPTRGRESVLRAEREEIAFEGGVLELWRVVTPAGRAHGAEAFLLSFGGNADRAEWMVAADEVQWSAKAVEVWALNYPGYGGSTGPARLARLPAAALRAYDHVASRAPGRAVVVNGSSLGTTLALHVASRRPAAGLVLRNPPPLRNLILTRFGWWNLWLLAGPIALKIPTEMDSLSNGGRVRIPALFLLSGNDEVVPVKYQRKVVAAYAGEHRVIDMEGALHNTPMEGRALEEFRAGLDWLWERAVDRRDSPAGS